MNGSISQRAADMLALKDIHVADLEDGTLCYVESGVPTLSTSPYYLDKTSGAVEDLTFGRVIEPWPGAPIAGAADARWLICLCGGGGPD